MTNATVLAAGTPADTWPGMGVAGTVVFLAICVGTFLLWRNMNRQIKKVDANLPTADELMIADIAAGTADPRAAARYRAREARRRQVGPNAVINPAAPTPATTPAEDSDGTSPGRV
jgi:Flp pilus assembly protein TadB